MLSSFPIMIVWNVLASKKVNRKNDKGPSEEIFQKTHVSHVSCLTDIHRLYF